MEKQNETAKKQPIRRCIGCGEHFPKNTLTRIVRTPEGEIIIDEKGKRSGRGAYICKSAKCLKKAEKQKRLEASLECSIPKEVYERLGQELEERG